MMSKIDNAQKIEKYKPLVFFILKGISFYLFFFVLKIIHRSIIGNPSKSVIYEYLRKIDIYEIGAKTLIYPATFIFNVFGIKTHSFGRTLFIEGGGGVEVQGPCLGINVLAVFISLIIAYPVKASFRKKLVFIIGGVLIIHLLNIIRISAVALNNDILYLLPINHHDLYNLVIYSVVLLLFYWWISNKYFNFNLNK